MGNLKGTAYPSDTYLKMKSNRLFRWKMKVKTWWRHFKKYIYG